MNLGSDRARIGTALLRIAELSMIRNLSEGSATAASLPRAMAPVSMASHIAYLTALQAWRNAAGKDFINVGTSQRPHDSAEVDLPDRRSRRPAGLLADPWRATGTTSGPAKDSVAAAISRSAWPASTASDQAAMKWSTIDSSSNRTRSPAEAPTTRPAAIRTCRRLCLCQLADRHQGQESGRGAAAVLPRFFLRLLRLAKSVAGCP